MNDLNSMATTDYLTKVPNRRSFFEAARKETKAEDLFARFGGEELILLPPDTAIDEAEKIAERARQRISESAWTCCKAGLRNLNGLTGTLGAGSGQPSFQT